MDLDCSSMEHDEEKPRGRRSYEIGPVGRRVAVNLKRIREANGLSQDEVAAAVRRLGNPMNRSAISKAEDAKRHVDVDDLVAFALALGAAPNRLLLTGTADAGKAIEVTPGYSPPERDAWMWALGELPLVRDCDASQPQEVSEVDRQRRFIQQNRPSHRLGHASGDPMREYPALRTAITNLINEARRSGIGISVIIDALQQAYLWWGGE